MRLPPAPRAAGAQPSCPTIVFPSAGRLPGRDGQPGTVGVWIKEGFPSGEKAPEPLTGREGEVYSPPDFPSLGSLLAGAWEARLRRKVGRGGIQPPQGTVGLVVNGRSSSDLCPFVVHAREERSS